MRSTTCEAVAPLPLKRATAPLPSTWYTVGARLEPEPIPLHLHTQPVMSGTRRTNTKREKTRENVATTIAAPTRVWHREAAATHWSAWGGGAHTNQVTFPHGKLGEGVAWKAVQRMVSVEEQKMHPKRREYGATQVKRFEKRQRATKEYTMQRAHTEKLSLPHAKLECERR
jgi:hypothetical protein